MRDPEKYWSSEDDFKPDWDGVAITPLPPRDLKQTLVDIVRTPLDPETELINLEECEQCGSLDKLTGYDLIEQRCPQTGYITGGRIRLCARCLRFEGIHDEGCRS